MMTILLGLSLGSGIARIPDVSYLLQTFLRKILYIIHRGEPVAILGARMEVIEEAKRKQPERWKGRPTRNLEEEKEKWLNPEKDGRTRESLTPKKRQLG